MGKLAGKVAVVTGASKGIGAGIAKGMAAEGASVVVNYSSSKEGADRVVQEITREGGKAIAVQGDMSKSADVKRLFTETKKAFGSVNILVNNAGVYQFDPLENVTEVEFHREFNTNVLGPILTTQESVKQFGPEGGSIINISSVASSNPPAMGLVYAATKSAVDSLTRSRWSWDPEKYASTPSRRAALKPKAFIRQGSLAAILKSRWCRTHRLVDWANRKILRGSQFSWPLMTRNG